MISIRFLISAILIATILIMSVGIGAANEVTLTLEGITADALPNHAMDVCVTGNHAYVADYTNGLVIVDISDPANPTTVGNFPSRIGDFDYTAAAIGVAVSGNYAYVANWYDDLYIIDVTDKTNPTLANTYTIDDGADSITISGNLAFIAAEWAGVDIIDISDPVNPVFIGNYNTDDLAEDVAIQNNYAYIADRDDGVIIVDVSDLANPSFVGSCDTPYDANSIVVSGAYAYVADADDTLIIDISNPASPAIVGQYDTTDSWGIVYDGNYVYVGDGGNGVVVLNVNDPANPVYAGSYDTVGYAMGLDIVGDLVYVADGPLVILHTDSSSTSGPVHNINKCTNYTTIQAAIDDANPGDEIHVDAGTYVENVIVDKQLALIGEGADMVIVQAADSQDHVIEVTADWVNLSGFTVTGTQYSWKAGIYLNHSNYSYISDNNASNNDCGILIGHSFNNNLQRNIYFDNWVGISLQSSSYNILKNNNASRSDYFGIHLEHSPSNTILNNLAFSNVYGGISVGESSSENNLTGNTANLNDGDGIYIWRSNNCILMNNNASSNGKIGIILEDANISTLSNNIVENNYGGIYLNDSIDNLIYHNNIKYNTNQANDDTSANSWDSGYPSGGNYWSDYIGNDDNKGLNQDQLGSDGIGDTPYPIPGGSSVDRYPLMVPWDAAPTTGPVHNINKGTDYTTIQAAIDDASPGDEIHVDSGTYYENVVVNKQLTLIGINIGFGLPVVDAGGSSSAITLNADGIILEGFKTINSGNNWYSDAGIKVTSNNNRITANIATENVVGIRLYLSNDNILIDNDASYNSDPTTVNSFGIFLTSSNNNTLTGNTASNNIASGIYLTSSLNNSLYRNIVNNNYGGISFYQSNNNTINENIANNNSQNGMVISESMYNTLTSNIASNNSIRGIYLLGSNNNILIGNTANNNSIFGIALHLSSYNKLSHNNLVYNSQNNALDTTGNNQWDSGTEGNYYSDYPGTDSNGDGIGDTPYPIPGGSSVDRYPLMNPWTAPPLSGKIAFASSRNGNQEVYVMNANGSGDPINLTNRPDADDGDPTWSPDGTKIAFSSNRSGNWTTYIMNADGSDQVCLLEGVYDSWGPAWSPDGKKIAVACKINPSDDFEIYTVDIQSRALTQVTYNISKDSHPAWSPDSHKIVFTSDRHYNQEIYVADLLTGIKTRLTENLSNDDYPEWSPDGSTIAFVSERDGNPEIYSMDITSKAITRLTYDDSTDKHAQWSPDGQKIVFISNRTGGDMDVYVMKADGTNITCLVDWEGEETHPTWSSGHSSPPAYSVGEGAPNSTIEQLFIDAYNRNGGVGVLGDPATEVHDAWGYLVQDFPGVPGIPGGVIMYNSIQNNASYIHGAIWERYYIFQNKSEFGPVKEDEKDAAPSQQGTTGRYSKFETGTIHWISDKNEDNKDHPQRGESFVTYGELDALYTSMGGTYNNLLGFPVMDQEDRGGYGYCEFEGGYIEWDGIEYKALKYIQHINIVGEVQYVVIPDMIEQPLKYVKIELDDDFYSHNGILGVGNTESDGSFNIEIEDNDNLNTIFVRIYADTEGSNVDKVLVSKIGSGEIYHYTKPMLKSSDFKVHISDMTSNKIFNIYSNVLKSFNYFKDNVELEKITVSPKNSFESGAYYNSEIFINYDYYSNQPDRNIVLYHEYGHFVMDSPYRVISEKPKVIFDDSVDAWIEGWATFASASTYGDETIPKIVLDEQDEFHLYYLDLENAKKISGPQCYLPYNPLLGQFPCEVDRSDEEYIRVAAFLWDVYDGEGGWDISERKDQFDGKKDVNTILDMFKSDKIYNTRYGTNQIYYHKTPLSVSEFYEGWISSNKPQVKELTKLVKHHFNDGYDHIILKSPANLHIYDSNNNHIGINTITGDIDREIIGSYYSGPESHPEEIFLLGEDGVDLKVEGTGDGTFTLTYESANNGIISNATYENIPVTSNSVGYITDTTNVGNRLLRMDYDGNGIIDQIILPTSMTILGDNLYNITFLPPITTMDQFNLTDGSNLPIKFTARNSTTDEFIYDDTVNVTITNSTGHLITYFTNGTGTDSVRINSEEEQYIANFHTKDYDLNVGETYVITVTFGELDSLRGYDITYFTLMEGGKAKGKSN